MTAPSAAQVRPLGPSILCASTAAIFVLLAGAFLVGALTIVSPNLVTFAPVPENHQLSEGQSILLIVLFTAAAACFVIAMAALTLAYRKLP